MGTFFSPTWFDDTPGTTKPLQDNEVAYTNETNTAQSIPLVDQGAAAREGIPEERVQAFVNRETITSPARPAAPETKTTQRAPMGRRGWLAVGVGLAVVFGVVMVLRRRKGA